ncbi:MAG: vitamin K epoxide reductase family protein [Saprospiraceae bacterium]
MKTLIPKAIGNKQHDKAMKGKLHIILKLLAHFSFKVPNNDLKIRLLSDPDEGIAPISNTLDFFGINNITATVPKTAFDQLPPCFMAQVAQEDQEDIVLVNKVSNGDVEIVEDENNSKTVTKEEFKLMWTGLIIAIEKNPDAANLVLDKKSYLKVGLISCVVLLTTYTAFLTGSLPKTLYTVCSILGLGISYLILKEKFSGGEAPSRFCTFSKNTDCNSVLNSKEAKLFSFADLSDASVVYFSFLLLGFSIAPTSIIFFALAICSLPVLIYSFYLQYFKIKKWCPLCLTIASILIIQFGLLWLSVDSLTFNTLDTLIFPLTLIVLILSWYHIKELLLLQQDNSILVIDNLRFRRNRTLFLPYYHSSRKIETKINSIPDICLGAPNSVVTFLMITNPLCKACFDAHSNLIKLFEKYGDKIQIRFRFYVPSNDRKDPRTIIAERLLELYLYENDNFKEAFQHWYSKVSINEWLHKWGPCKRENINDILSDHKLWCEQNHLKYTPAILINEKLFPRFYLTEDIENFLDPIITYEAQRSGLTTERRNPQTSIND